MSTTDPYEIIATLDTAIKRVTEELEAHPVDYVNDPRVIGHKETVKQLQSLHQIRKDALPDPTAVLETKSASKKDRVKFKDFIPAIASIGGILVIVTFEAFGHTLTSKATAFVSKSK